MNEKQKKDTCCGASSCSSASKKDVRPSDVKKRFMSGVISTVAGDVPQVKTKLDWQDHLGAFRVRIGVKRDDYKVVPGLYAVGSPGRDSSVFVTANYKLTFDVLRKDLDGFDAWILVLDTRGINVWCAGGKGTFSDQEVVRQIENTCLSEVVSHRKIILPQLGANGVAAFKVKKNTGFKVIWGPVRSSDIKEFIRNDFKADEEMRTVRFGFFDRFVLVPVEFSSIIKFKSLWFVLFIFLISGIGSTIFSLDMALARGGMLFLACVLGIAAGAVLTPLLLPWIPGRMFAIKGMLMSFVISGVFVFISWDIINAAYALTLIALTLVSTSISSFFAMNFTGASTFTSPTGVEKEMRRTMPVQVGMVVIGLVLWIVGGFN